jgi:glutathione S-transferase
VDELWDIAGRSILPTDPYHRALARFWAAYTDDKVRIFPICAFRQTVSVFFFFLSYNPGTNVAACFFAAIKLFPAYFGIHRAAMEEERAEKTNETIGVIRQLEVALAECSNGKSFFAGNFVGYLDIVVGCHLFWLEAFSRMFGVALLDAAKTPLFAAWAGRFKEVEAAKEVVPDANKVVEYFKNKRQG